MATIETDYGIKIKRVERYASGFCNNYRLQAKEGSFFLKVYPPKIKEGHINNIVKLRDLLLRSDCVLDVKKTLGGLQYSIHDQRAIEIYPFVETSEYVAPEEKVSCLARFHSALTEAEFRDIGTFDGLLAFLLYELGENLSFFQKFFDTAHVGSILKDLRMAQYHQTMIHGDAHQGNFMMFGGKTRIIDFDSVIFGPKMFDLATLASSVSYVDKDNINFELFDLCLKRYLEDSGDAEGIEDVFKLMVTYHLKQVVSAYISGDQQRCGDKLKKLRLFLFYEKEITQMIDDTQDNTQIINDDRSKG